MLLPLWAKKHLVLTEKVGDIEPMRFQDAICPLLCLPKSIILDQSEKLRETDDAIHVLSGSEFFRGIRKFQMQRRSFLEHQTYLMVQFTIKRQKNLGRIVICRSHETSGTRGLIHCLRVPTPFRIIPVITTKRVGCGSTSGCGTGLPIGSISFASA